MELPNVIIISGPSGAGEDSVIEGLRAHTTVNRVITTTTRAPREGESDGDPYYFSAKDDFKRRIADGEMIEWAQQYNGNLYGVTRDELQRVNDASGIGVWKIEYKGVMTAKDTFPGILAILVMAESLEVLEQRIRARSEVTDDFIAERMAYTKEWLTHEDIYDHKVINYQGKLDETIQGVVDILRKEQYL